MIIWIRGLLFTQFSPSDKSGFVPERFTGPLKNNGIATSYTYNRPKIGVVARLCRIGDCKRNHDYVDLRKWTNH